MCLMISFSDQGLGHFGSEMSDVFKYSLNPGMWGALDKSVSISKIFRDVILKKVYFMA